MSELINNSKYRKEKLKELILKLHHGSDPQTGPCRADKHVAADTVR